MRRAMLTTGGPRLPAVGESSGTSIGDASVGVAWDESHTAASAGSLTKATVVVSTTVSVYLAIFTVRTSLKRVRDISATIAVNLTAGANTIVLPAPLTVDVGDGIGVWFGQTAAGPGGAVGPIGLAEGGRSYHISSATPKPSADTTLVESGVWTSHHVLLSADF